MPGVLFIVSAGCRFEGNSPAPYTLSAAAVSKTTYIGRMVCSGGFSTNSNECYLISAYDEFTVWIYILTQRS